jgi:hypothetical protein
MKRLADYCLEGSVHKKLLVGALLAISSIGSASATPILISNFSFESPVLSPTNAITFGTNGNAAIPGWTQFAVAA